MSLFKPKEEKFWQWFVQNEDELLLIKTGQEPVFQTLVKKFRDVSSNTVFAFGPTIDDKREFIINADGMKKFIPEVLKLTESAPKMSKWNIAAFRQPVKEDGGVILQDLEMKPDDVYFGYLDGKDKNMLDLKFYIKNYDSADSRYLGCLFLLLDNALGEYTVMTKLGAMEFEKLPEDYKNMALISLNELPQIVKTKFSK